MKGECIIDGIDVFTTYGVVISEDGYNNLLPFNEMLEPDKNNWPDEHGIEVDLSSPVLKAREISIPFLIKGSDVDEFITFLSTPGYREFEIPSLNRTWSLRLSKETSNIIYTNNTASFTLVFVEDKVTRKTDVSSPGGGVPILSSSYQIDGISLEGYGIVISSGENDILKMPSIKQNLTCSFSTSDGQVYDTGKVYFSEKEVTLSGTFFASDIDRFWSCYEAFFFNLIRPGERRIYVDQTGEEYPCYYKKSSNFKIISLTGRVVVDFSFTLVLTSCKANNTEYFLATEDGAFITTEDDYFIDLSRVQTPEPVGYSLETPQTLAETAPEEVEIRKRKITEMPLAGSLDNLIVPAVDKTTNRNVHIPSELLKKEEGGTSNVFQLSDLKDVDKNVDNAADGMVLQKQGEKWVAAVVEGGGSSGGGITMKLKSLTGTLLTGIAGGEIRIGYNFTSVYNDDGTETGGGTATYKVNSQKVNTLSIRQGDNYFDVSSYLVVGTNTVEVSVKDSTGATRTLSYTVELISLQISSPFDVSQIFDGAITFKYVPTGAISKVIHFILDGTALDTVTTSVSNRQLSYAIPAQSHGSHTLKVYMTADVNGQEVTSNVLFYDFICIVEGNTTPVIASSFNQTRAVQYEMLSIPFLVYSPSASTSPITLSVNGTTVSQQTVDRVLQTWNYRLETAGEVTLKIACLNVYKQFTLTVEESSIDVHPESADLELYLTSANRSNSDNNRQEWNYNDIHALLSDFNFKTNGWISTGNSVALRVSGDARVTIPLPIFAEDFRAGGKTIEFEFETRDVIDYEAVVINCLSGGIGLQVSAQEAAFKSEQTTVTTRFKEEERVRVSFVVEKKTDNRLIYIYINGIMSGVAQYPEQDNFQQRTPVGITIGNNNCTVDLYNIRIYGNNLTQYQMLDNYIADIDDFDKKLSVYLRNKVYNDYGDISYNSVLSQLPCMIITGDLPTYKGDKKTVSIDYTSRQEPSRSFTATGVQIDVQGTSSQYYPRKNFKFKLKNGLTMSESGETKTAYPLRPDGIPATVFCTKADFAESSGTHNTGMAKVADKLLKDLDILTPPQKVNDKVRTTVDGFPICIFHRTEENGVIEFVGKYNFNYDKGAEETFGFTEGDESWEFCNNTSERVLFKSADFTGTDWMNDFEARYPDDDTINAEYEAGTRKPANLMAIMEWVVSTANDQDKFKAGVAGHFDLNNLLSYYLFTEIFAMVDQRAKNMFLTRFAADGKWRFILYDNDTCLGINNEGLIAFNFNVEYHDRLGTQNVWNGEDSVLWKNVETCFSAEIEAMYKDIRSKGYLSYDYVMSVLNGEQSDKWCEAIYNADGKFKYIDPLVEEGNGSYLYAAQGSRVEHRKWWTYNRFLYMDSKYTAGDFLSDFATLRLYTPSNWASVTPRADFTIVPFADEYIRVKYGSYIVGQRGQKDTVLHIKAPDIVFNDTETIIYGASRIKSLGDLSGLYAGTIDVSKATRLSELIIGSGAEGYHNDNLTVLAVGANKMLRRLDIRNCPNLTQAVDLSGCENVEEVYAGGTGITSVVLPTAGILTQLHLPGTVSNLTIKNQVKLTESGFEIAGVDNLSTIVYENSGIDILSLLERCLTLPVIRLSRVRLIGIDGMADNLNTLYKLKDLGGIDENGNNTPRAVVTGKYYVAVAREDQLAELQENFPELTITYGQLKPPTVTTFVFKSSQNKTISNSSFECNLPYKKVNETTYTVTADDGTTIDFTFKCDNHKDYSDHYVVAGTRAQNCTVTYIPLRTIQFRIYNTSTNVKGVRVTIDGTPYLSDDQGKIYIRNGSAMTGTAVYPGYASDPLNYGVITNDTTHTCYLYQAVDITFIVKSQVGSLVQNATVACNGQSGITNIYGECVLQLSKGTYEYAVTHPDCFDTTGSISVDTTAKQVNVDVLLDPEALRPKENGNIQMMLVGGDCQMTISASTPNYIIDWGDGGTTSAVGTSYQTYRHSYENNGIYQVEILNCEDVRSCNASQDCIVAYWSIGNSRPYELSFYNCTKLIAIGDIFKKDKNRSNFNSCFSGCSNLTTIPAGLFDNCTKATSFYYCFSSCNKLTTIPIGLFDNCPEVTNFQSCFNWCSKLTTIPTGLFDHCTKVTDFQECFYVCGNLTTIPAGLFDNCTKVTNFKGCFSNCGNLTSIPIGLFDNCPEVTNFQSCFNWCSKLTTIPTGLFDHCTKVTDFQSCFGSCKALTAIPVGLFDNCPEVTNFQSCFNNCEAITTIPTDLFDYCPKVAVFSSCFSGCSSLTTIPAGLFDNCTKVTDFGHCFSACSGLTTIPTGLFDPCPEVTNFGYCFSACSGLTSIPTGLFDHCPKVTNFYYCFSVCKALTTIPAGLFDSCTKVTNFGYCFYNCKALTAIPVGLFDNCTEVTDFGYCFYDCEKLTAIPAGLFNHCTKVTNFQDCFYGCKALTAIPVGLFDNCPEVTNFYDCFSLCSGLTFIPTGLFDHCLKVTNFQYCFRSCSNITSNLPPLWILYYGKSISKYYCFNGCTSAANWQEVPQSWGGPGPEYEPPSSVVLSQRSGVVMADYRALDVRLKNIEQQLNIN